MSPEYQAANFAPGDEVPEWALDQVGDHVLEAEEPSGSEDADGSDESDESDQEQADDSSGDSGADDESDGDGEDDTPPADDQPDFTAPAPARRGRARK
jgi:hypothetical protein